MFKNKTVNIVLALAGLIIQSLIHVEGVEWVATWGAFLANIGAGLLWVSDIKQVPPINALRARALFLIWFVGLCAVSACKLWPTPKEDVVNCTKEAARDVWSTEMQHLRELINAGVTYDSVRSHAAGLVVRFGKPFVICLWERIRSGDALQSGDESIRAKAYADRWLAEHS